ncbi:MAG TPA: hypothetical protein VJR89_00505 [Polyangiales bacterium]|nr:hypothetical protein [Polyangiales bacterium]
MTANTNTLHAVRFLALAFTALALMPAGAHLLELPNKLGLSADEYLIAQRLYRGWALLGVVVIGALLSTGALVLTLRGQAGFGAAMVALTCILATQIVFWSTTYPVNVATHNWSMLPVHWKVLRLRWEYSHVVSAILNLAALFATCIAVLRSSTSAPYLRPRETSAPHPRTA